MSILGGLCSKSVWIIWANQLMLSIFFSESTIQWALECIVVILTSLLAIYILCYCCDRQTNQYHYWWVCLSQQSPWYKPCIWCMSGVPQFNSSPPSATYMRRWTGPSLVQVNGLSPIRRQAITWFNQCWLIDNWTPGNKFQWNMNGNSIIFIQENALENVVCQNGGHFVHGEMSWYGPSCCPRVSLWVLKYDLRFTYVKLYTVPWYIGPYYTQHFLNCLSFPGTRDHSVHALSQWETTLHCNVVSHWLGSYTKWSLWTRKFSLVAFNTDI